MADGQVIFDIAADSSNIESAIKKVTSDIQQESKKWDSATKNATDDMGNAFGSMVSKVAGLIAGAKIGQMILSWGKAAVDTASDLAEVQNVVDTVFGEGSSKIESWAKKAGDQFGLTELQAKKFTSTLGAMMKSSGLAGDEIVGMSTDLAGLAADMASFYNLDFETAFEKIRSGISGETMPLKQLGINMSVANLNAFALAQGLEKTFDQMSQGEQTMLRYQYLMQATADAQGDFEKTSDGFANAQRRITTALDTISATAGTFLLNTISPLVSGVADLLTKLTSTPERTVLDDFNDIEIDTEGKLKAIKETATEAGLLVEELDKITGSKVETVKKNIQSLATGLSNVSFDQDKTGIIKDFIGTLASNIDAIAAIQGTDADGAKEWLTSIGKAAESLSPEDAAGWKSLIDSIKEGLPGLENTDFGSAFFAALGGEFSSIEKQTSVYEWAIDSLGSKTSRTAEEQALWLEICKRLVQTIPGLSSIINTETGEVEGGTQAVKDYITAWEEGQTKLAMLRALEQKESALETRFADLPGLELDMAVAERKVRKQKEKIEALKQKYGLTANLLNPETGYMNATIGAQELRLAAKEYNELVDASTAATKAYYTQKDALDEAEQALAEYRETIEDMPGDTEAASEALEDYGGRSAEVWAESVKGAKAAAEAIKAVTDYYKGVRDATAQSVNATVKGFSEIGKAGDELRTKQDELGQQASKVESEYASVFQKWGGSDWNALQRMSDNWDSLTDAEKNAYNALAKIRNEQKEVNDQLNQYSAEGMKKGLQDQIKYMEEYLSNLETLKSWGVSDAMLASLSDGSKESAEYLAGLVAGGKEQATEVGALYDQVEQKKQGFTDSLTAQKLTVDETYNAMVEKAKEAMSELDLGDEAKNAMGETVRGIAEGIRDNVSDVSAAVSELLAALDPLTKYGFTWGYQNGGFQLSLDGSHETGLDYVPFNGYLAELHEGEGILTAEENRIWQRFKNGQAGTGNVDYDALGGIMRDNVRAGGDVFLDGRTVGRVISDIQGNQYRTMQRSGFQQ